MSVQDGLSPEVSQATARVNQILAQPAEAADVIVNAVVEICQSLPQPFSAADLVSALQPRARSQLETMAMQRFQRRQRSRLDGSMPRPVAELRSASRAWKLSPLVLLIEFADAPASDNFWRALSRLARASRDWRAARERLAAQRHRRQHDLLSRRQGLSYRRPWTIPDVQAVLRQNGSGRGKPDEAGGHGGSMRTGTALPDNADVPDPIVPVRHAEPEYSKENSDAWSMSIGWWLSGDSIHRICDSLLQYQSSSFLSVDPQTAGSASRVPPRRYQRAASTLFLPIYTKEALHWNLCVFSLDEKIISAYVTLPDHWTAAADIASTIESSFHALLPGEAFSDWSVVRRGCCPSLRHGADSGVAVIVFVLYHVCGRALPLELNFWLWRRVFAIYITRASCSSAGAEQAAKDAAMADQMAAGVTEMFRSEVEKENKEENSSAHQAAVPLGSRRSLLLGSIVEARAVWTATADLVRKSEANRRPLQAENSIAEAREPVPGAAGLSYAMDAVLRDLNWLVSWLAESTFNGTAGAA